MDDLMYECKAKRTMIKFNSRASVKIKDSYYTFEYGEERQIDNPDEVDMKLEIEALCNDCNNVVDDQIKEIVDMVLQK